MNYLSHFYLDRFHSSPYYKLGVVLPDLHGEFFSEVIRGIDLAARRERFQILLSSSHADADALSSAVRVR